jgi:FkbM family methyltransferase
MSHDTDEISAGKVVRARFEAPVAKEARLGDSEVSVANELKPVPAHPSFRSRFARSFRLFRNVRGWPRLANALADREGTFTVSNGGVVFSGDLASPIDRHAYLFGGYDLDSIQLFIAACRDRRLVLDIGANVGNHSMFFASAFKQVEAFEPNSALWSQFERNAALNGPKNIRLHRFGLSDRPGQLPLYTAGEYYHGLGTLIADYPYGQSLDATSIARLEVLDDYLPDLQPSAVKIDVQGFEANVLRGMRRILEKSRPVVWTEVGQSTLGVLNTVEQVQQLFPYRIRLEALVREKKRFKRRVRLVPLACDKLRLGDYLIFPDETSNANA